MFLSLVLLSSLLLYASGDVSTRLSTHSSRALKTKCDALPYRTVFLDSDCYFITDVDTSGTEDKCSLALKGAKLAKEPPAKVLQSLFAERDELMIDGDSSKKKKALCLYGSNVASDFPCAAGASPSTGGSCIRREEPNKKITFRILAPFRGEFTKKIEIGQTITIKGTFSTVVDHFTINLMTKDQSLVAFHFNPRFGENKVFLDYYKVDWSYGRELKPMPFRRGEAFDIRIRIHSTHYQVFVDNKEFCTYNHRLPIDTITHLWVDGSECYINYVHLGEKYEPVPRESASATVFSICKQQICGKSFVQVSDCKSLRISGSVIDRADSITVNLVRRNGDVALHFNPRYWNTPTVLNSFKNGQWLTEELISGNPFRKGGERFELEITNGANSFHIYVNGVHYASFAHRTCPFDFTGVDIGGFEDLDVQIK